MVQQKDFLRTLVFLDVDWISMSASAYSMSTFLCIFVDICRVTPPQGYMVLILHAFLESSRNQWHSPKHLNISSDWSVFHYSRLLSISGVHVSVTVISIPLSLCRISGFLSMFALAPRAYLCLWLAQAKLFYRRPLFPPTYFYLTFLFKPEWETCSLCIRCAVLQQIRYR